MKAGAFDSLGVARSRLFEGIPRALDIGSRAQADRASGQTSLFEAFGTEQASSDGDKRSPDEGLPDVADWPERERLAKERSVLGLYVSGHPLSGYEKWLRVYSNADTRTLAERDGTEVVLGGMLQLVQFRTSQKTGQPWARLQVEDLMGSAEARVFRRTLETCRDQLATDRVVLLAGRVDGSGREPTLLVDEVVPFEEATLRLTGRVTIRVKDGELDDERIEDLLTVIKASPGMAEVYFRVERAAGGDVIVRAGDDLRAGPGEQLDSDVEAVLGPGRLVVEPSPERFRSTGDSRRRGRRRGRAVGA